MTVRMRKCGTDQTLNGYVFSDVVHAREWLNAYADKPGGFELEEVVVGPFTPCSKCGGSGYHQTVTRVRSLSMKDVFSVR